MTNTTISTCSGTFFDSGGAAANYGNNQNLTMTFCSAIAGQQIYVVFTSFATQATFDVLTVYNGPNTASPIIGSYSGTTSPGTVASTSGCLTFVFTSNLLTANTGWVGQIGCGTPPPPPPAPPTAICQTAQPFCTGTTVNFPAGTNNGSAFSSGYNCLATSPNPAWYYMEIQNPGNLDITMSSSPLLDIDFVMWGPFNSLSSMCTSYSLANVIDCSYSTAAIEYANITNATTGQFYLLLITNFSNTPCNISFTQSGGAATTNCNILCNMVSLTATPSVCTPATNTYSVSGQVTFQYPPPSGTFTISSSCGGTPVNIPSSISLVSPYNYTIPNIPANGSTCTITASFSADPTCNKTATVTAPISCNCAMVATPTITPVSCIGLSNGAVSLAVTNALGTPTYSWILPGGGTSSASALSGLAPGVYTCYVTDPGATNCVKIVNANIGTTPDVTLPTILNCPANLNLTTATGLCTAVANWATPTTSDNCGAVITQTLGPPSGTSFSIGTTNIVYTAHDSAGNTKTCSFNVVVTDNQPPVIQNCYTNITANNDLGSCGAVINWVTPTVTDNCPNPSIVQTTGLASGSLFPIGTTTITYIATDAAGLKDTCTFDIIISETEAPIINNCPSNIVMGASANACGVVVNWANVSVSDNCPNATLTQTAGLANGSFFPIGLDTITYIANDAYGHSDTCTFTVQVIDNVAPIISNCPANINVNNSPNICGAVVSWGMPTVTDNCGAILTQTTGLANGDTFPAGITTVTYVAHDSAGNTASCSFTVTVTDTEPPIILNCPTNINVSNDAGLCGAVVSWTLPTITDNCPNPLIANNISSGSFFPLGTTNVNYTVTDVSGNVTTCDFSVTVIDSENPIISNCPTNITLNATSNCQAIANWAAPMVSDNCPNPNIISNFSSGATFPFGTTTVTYNATDASGNTATCSFTVTIIDSVAPVFVTCPSNITLNANANCSAVANWTTPVVSDNCPNPVVTSNYNSGTLFPLGQTTVTYTATDAVGNSSTCSFVVNVVDNMNPTISGCPANISVNNTTGLCGAIVSWVNPTVADNCGAILMQTTGLANGDTFPIGAPTLVTYVAHDSAGNTASCSFTVTVVDNELPIIQNCPANITVNNTLGLCGAIVSWVSPTITDNCSVLVTNTANPNDTFPVGLTFVNYTATDPSGNTTVCNFSVTVNDTEAPIISNCPSDTTISANVNCQGVYNWTIPTVNDNCPNPTLVSNIPSGAALSLGANTITYIATDAAGNQDNCSFIVTVVDDTPPIFVNCPANITISANANCQAVGNWVLPTVTDNCPNVSISSNYNTGDIFNIGTTTVTYNALDAAGNTASCSFTVTVIDNTPPIILNCPANITLNLKTRCDTIVSWIAPLASDNCPNVTLTSNIAPNTLFSIGTTNVVYTATDAAGNTATCTFNVTVVAPPALTANTNVLQNVSCFGVKDGSANVTVSGGSGAYTYTWNTTPVKYTSTIYTIAAGTYTVVIKDAVAAACVISISKQVTINEPAALAISLTKVNPACKGYTNGNITANVLGGTLPYAYSWNTTPAQIGTTATNLGAGTYTVYITDGNGCKIQKTQILTEPSLLTTNLVVHNVKCFGKNTGNVFASPQGGTPPYTYQWTGNASATSTATDYFAGSYSLTITDANNCVVTKNFTLTQPATPVSVSTTQIDASCFGYTDGSATATIAGGVPPYNVVWGTSPVQTGMTATNLKAGKITVTATDSNGCKQSNIIEILQPNKIETSLSYMNEAYCNRANGSALVIANGGFSPYTYTWALTPAQYGENLISVAEGDYKVWVHDAKGCKDSLSVHVTNVPPPIADFISQPDNTNAVLLSQANFRFVNQSVGAAAYFWDFGDGNTAIDKSPRYTFLDTGIFVVTLVAYNSYGNACPDTAQMSFTVIPDGTIFIPTAFSPNGDGLNDVVKVEGVGIIRLEWTIFDRWGKLIYQTNAVGESWDGTKNGKGVPEGVYTYKVSASLNGGMILNKAGTITLIR